MYIPKDRIKPNLYTPGNEFVIKDTGESYVGCYHSLYTGKFYTGKNQNDYDIREIVSSGVPGSNNKVDLPPDSTNINKIALFLQDPDPPVGGDNWNPKDIVTFLALSGKSITNDDPKTVPFQKYPEPTQNDYQLGEFQRYFCKKRNEFIYLEISKSDYSKLVKQDSAIDFTNWAPFSIPWTLTGNESQVYNTNRNIVLLEEKNKKFYGFGKYLRGDYLRYYKS